MVNNLSKRQEDILAYINAYYSNFGMPPTIREICSAVGLLSSSSVFLQLRKLQEKGYLSVRNRTPRSIVLTKPPNQEDVLIRLQDAVSTARCYLDGTVSRSTLEAYVARAESV